MKKDSDRAAIKIRRVPREESGRLDGVKTVVDCVIHEFKLDANNKPVELCAFPAFQECEIIAARSSETVSISIRGTGKMISIRFGDLADLLAAANEASEE